MQDVLMQMGQEGIGIFWCLVEKMYKEGGKLELDKCNSYAFALHVDSKKIEMLINIIFEKDSKYFWSNSVLKRIKLMREKSKVKKFAAQKRWENEAKKSNAQPMHMHSTTNADAKHNKVNKIKENKEIKDTPKSPIGELSVFLEVFNEKFRTNYKETDGRKKKLKNRLESYALDQILLALDNLSQSKFHQGQNDRNWKADPDFLLRSDEQIDKWINSAPKQKKVEIKGFSDGQPDLPEMTEEEKVKARKASEAIRKRLHGIAQDKEMPEIL